jgi:hypothetical protein
MHLFSTIQPELVQRRPIVHWKYRMELRAYTLLISRAKTHCLAHAAQINIVIALSKQAVSTRHTSGHILSSDFMAVSSRQCSIYRTGSCRGVVEGIDHCRTSNSRCRMHRIASCRLLSYQRTKV